jgi:dienelactone hydrolase
MRSLSAGVLLLACGLLHAEPPLPRYPDRSNLLAWKDDAGKLHPVKTTADWAKRQAHILEGMQEIMGRLPSDKEKVPLDVQYGEEVKTPKYTRKKLTFAAEKDDRVPAWLLVPHGLKGKAPAVLCLHQTVAIGKDEPAGLGKNPDLAYAHHLAERGYVTLAPDYPSFGEYKFDVSKSRFPSGSMKAIWNNIRAVDLLASLPEVDAERIGVIGHSLGGHNGMFTAAFDTRLKAIVSNCGFTSFPKYYGGNLKGWTSARYMPRVAAVHNNKPDRLPFDFPEVVASFAPRAFLASSPLHDDNFEVSGVRDCIAIAEPVYGLFGVKDRLQANYPNCKHEFPEKVRAVAYDFLDRWLKGAESPGGKLSLTVRETAGLRRFGYPVHALLRLPREVKADDRFRLLEGGKPVEAQFRSLAGVGMKTAVALDFNVSLGPEEEKAYQVEYGPAVEAGPEPKRGLRVEETKEEIKVHSGGMAWTVRRDLKGLIHEMRDGKRRYVKPGSEGLQILSEPRITLDMGVPRGESLRVTREGPLTVALRYEGYFQGREYQLPGVVDLVFPRSKSWVEVDARLTAREGLVGFFMAQFHLDLEGEPLLLDFGANSTVYTTLRANERARLSASGSDWTFFKGKVKGRGTQILARSPKGARPAPAVEGWMHIMDKARCAAVALEECGRTPYRESLEAAGDGKYLIERSYIGTPAGERRLRFWMHFVPMPVQVGAVTSPQSMMAPLEVEVRLDEPRTK